MSMIQFEEHPDLGRGQTRLITTINERALVEGGKVYLEMIIKKIIDQMVIGNRRNLDALVASALESSETKAYITAKTREIIDRYIEEDVKRLFSR